MALDVRQHEFTDILGAPYVIQEDERGVLWLFEGDDGTRVDAMIGGRWLAPLAAEILRLKDQVHEELQGQADISASAGAAYDKARAEIARLASPEAAWETVEAFNRGALHVDAQLLRPYCPGLHDLEMEFAVRDLRRNPWQFCVSALNEEPGRALFAECLRLGREGRT